MKITLEVLAACCVEDDFDISDLQTKELVPKMLLRRRLTKISKIAIYLASKVGYSNQRIIYGSSFGELNSTSHILDSILKKEPISPTHFQNSVYNTPVSYLSILSENTNEIITISSGDDTSKTVLKVGAVKALDRDEIILMVVEGLNIPNIEEVNPCGCKLESGVALRIRLSPREHKTIDFDSSNPNRLPLSVVELTNIAKKFDSKKMNIIEVVL